MNKYKRESNESSRTGSSTSIIRKNGELFAVVHNTSPERGQERSSYSGSSLPSPTKSLSDTSSKLSTETTYHKFFQPRESASPDKKQLMPYHPDSLRSRPPVKFKSEPIKHVRHCAPRNVHQFDFAIGRSSDTERTRFKTTQRSTFVDHASNGPPIGFSNGGISSDATKWIKKRLAD